MLTQVKVKSESPYPDSEGRPAQARAEWGGGMTLAQPCSCPAVVPRGPHQPRPLFPCMMCVLSASVVSESL